jgi:hypothetical protein
LLGKLSRAPLTFPYIYRIEDVYNIGAKLKFCYWSHKAKFWLKICGKYPCPNNLVVSGRHAALCKLTTIILLNHKPITDYYSKYA